MQSMNIHNTVINLYKYDEPTAARAFGTFEGEMRCYFYSEWRDPESMELMRVSYLTETDCTDHAENLADSYEGSIIINHIPVIDPPIAVIKRNYQNTMWEMSYVTANEEVFDDYFYQPSACTSRKFLEVNAEQQKIDNRIREWRIE